MQDIRRGFGVLFVFLIVMMISGCSTFGDKNKQTTMPSLLEPQSIVKFTDVPVPMGFQLSTQDSYSFETTGVRVGVLKYRGKAQIELVESFYKEQMPMYNWTLLNAVEYGERLLNFDRTQESCIITLEPKGSTTIITISLGPKSQISKKSERPVK
jgi:hypothetical protein